MVWENIEEIERHPTLFIRSSQFIFVCNFYFLE